MSPFRWPKKLLRLLGLVELVWVQDHSHEVYLRIVRYYNGKPSIRLFGMWEKLNHNGITNDGHGWYLYEDKPRTINSILGWMRPEDFNRQLVEWKLIQS